jgi:shikimate kinase
MAPSIAMIQLIGPGGAGKSTVGVLLATRLGCPFRDLDREFERRRADIDTFIGVHGYDAYARENVVVYLELAPHLPGTVLALSSGFMVYPPAVHLTYSALRHTIARSRTTIVLLPSLDRETCVAETVRRQLGRPFGRRDPAREEAVIRERFDRYMDLPAMKVETMRPAHEVAGEIHARLAADAPGAPAAASRTPAADHRAIQRCWLLTSELRKAAAAPGLA